jgi:hypothetical protein
MKVNNPLRKRLREAAKGAGIKQLREAFPELSDSLIRYHAGDLMVPTRKGGQRRFDHDLARQMIVGSSYRKVAEHFGVSVPAIYAACNPEKYGRTK